MSNNAKRVTWERNWRCVSRGRKWLEGRDIAKPYTILDIVRRPNASWSGPPTLWWKWTGGSHAPSAEGSATPVLGNCWMQRLIRSTPHCQLRLQAWTFHTSPP